MTPKGLLRLKQASSTLDELADGRLPAGARRRRAPTTTTVVRARALLREGLLRHRRPRARAPARPSVAVARLEQLYPFPVDRARGALASYPRPRGGRLGAGGAAEHGGVALDPPPPRGGGPVEPGARASATSAAPWRASPSEGYPTAHQREQDRIVREALGVADEPEAGQRSRRRARALAAAAAAAATRGPCVRAASSSIRRCAGGSRRHRRKAARPSATGLVRDAACPPSNHTTRPPSVPGRLEGAEARATLRRGQRRRDTRQRRGSWQQTHAFPRILSPRTPQLTRAATASSLSQGDPGAPRAEAAERRRSTRHAARPVLGRGPLREPPALQVRGAGAPRGDARGRRGADVRAAAGRGPARTRAAEGPALDEGLWGRSRDFDWGE